MAHAVESSPASPGRGGALGCPTGVLLGPPRHRSRVEGSSSPTVAVCREDEIGRELGQRLERKAPLRDAWMRHGQARLVQYDLAVDEQVEVDRPRAPPFAGAIATERLLDREEDIEQRPRLEAGLELDDAVQVPRLLDRPPRVRLAEPRDRRDLDARIGPEQVDRPTDRRLPVAEVRSDADVRAHDRDGSDPPGLGL